MAMSSSGIHIAESGISSKETADVHDLSCQGQLRQRAAMKIQAAAIRRLICPGIQIERSMLLDRLELELHMRRGLRLFFLCIVLFVVILCAHTVEADSLKRLGLMQTFKTVFLLDDSLADIKTIHGLRGYLQTISARSRLLMPLSMEYFSEQEGEIRIFEGIRSFEAALPLNVRDMHPKVDTLEWTMTAWVQLEKEGGATIIRKPLSSSEDGKHLSCWSWYVGWPNDRFEYGAHDFGGSTDSHIMQESIVSSTASAEDGEVHYVALVVFQDKLEMWVDAEKKFEGALPRPVTDCSGLALEVGSQDVPRLGEITFYPHKMTQVAMKEIYFAGFTLEAIAEGKVPYTPVQDIADVIATRTGHSFDLATGERSAAEKQVQVEATLTRATVDVVENAATTYAEHHAPKIVVANKAGCDPASSEWKIPMFGTDTSCHYMDLAGDAKMTDSLNSNKQYYNMVPTAVRPTVSGSKVAHNDRMEVDHMTPNEYLRYDAETWPSFCGKSATFSMWLETDTVHGGALLSRYSAVNTANGHSDLEWALYAEGYGLCVRGKRAPSKSYVPSGYGLPLEYMKYMQRRHVAYVFDKDKDETRTYLDGSLLGTTKHSAGTIAKLDCDLNGKTAYTGFGHLAPGTWGLKGAVQDWRYYPDVKLSEAELKKLAEESKDSSNKDLRSCEHRKEGGDTEWIDLYGHDCSWYYKMRKRVPGVCTSAEVKKQCPEACGVKKPCYEAHVDVMTYDIWNRVMLLEDSLHHKGMGVVCARESVDLLALCEKNQKTPDTSPAPGASGIPIPKDGSAYEEKFMDIPVADCEYLKKVVNPYCAFGASNTHIARRDTRRGGGGSTSASASVAATTSTVDWAKEMHKKVKASGGWTLEFWMKIDSRTRIPENNEDYKSQATSMRRIVFFSKVSPPRVLATLTLRSHFDDVEFQAYGTCSKDDVGRVSVNFPRSEPLKPDMWFKISMVFGAKNQYGKKGIQIMEGSQVAFQVLQDLHWCESNDDFIQAIQLPGGVIISPIQLTLEPLYIKELQERYYHQKDGIQVRRGPAHTDKKRKTNAINYNRQPYSYPVVLTAPPVILQHRLEKTINCSTYAGKDFLQSTWNHTVNGEKCHAPYDCGNLFEGETTLLSCRNSQQPEKFFGGHKLGAEFGPGLQGWFFEFLQTVTNAHIVKRIDQRRRIFGSDRRIDFDTAMEPGGSRRAAAGGGAKTASGSSKGAGSMGGSATTNGPAKAVVDVPVGTVGDDILVLDPARYLDFQTSEIEILLAAFSPDYGIGSLIRIDAKITSEVQLDYFVQHYQATEGTKLHQYEFLTGSVFILCVIILIDQIWVLYNRSRWEQNFNLIIEIESVAFELLLQCILPIIFFTMRLVQIEQSGKLLDHTVGHDGLAGMPWDDPSVELPDKVRKFFDLIHEFQEEMWQEDRMFTFFFVMAFVQLGRLFFQTQAHPRTAMLVQTIRKGADDMAHFLVLVAIIMSSFVLLGVAAFGSSRPEFRDGEAGFRTLWEMMLGSMLQNGATLNETWTHQRPLMMFQLIYMILVFLILLNFIIAIVVEAYMKVVQDLEDCEVEQSLWQDVAAISRMMSMMHLRKWPYQAELIKELKRSKRTYVDYHLLRQLFPTWRNRGSIIAWLDFYSSYPFLASNFEPERHTRDLTHRHTDKDTKSRRERSKSGNWRDNPAFGQKTSSDLKPGP